MATYFQNETFAYQNFCVNMTCLDNAIGSYQRLRDSSLDLELTDKEKDYYILKFANHIQKKYTPSVFDNICTYFSIFQQDSYTIGLNRSISNPDEFSDYVVKKLEKKIYNLAKKVQTISENLLKYIRGFIQDIHSKTDDQIDEFVNLSIGNKNYYKLFAENDYQNKCGFFKILSSKNKALNNARDTALRKKNEFAYFIDTQLFKIIDELESFINKCNEEQNDVIKYLIT